MLSLFCRMDDWIQSESIGKRSSKNPSLLRTSDTNYYSTTSAAKRKENEVAQYYDEWH